MSFGFKYGAPRDSDLVLDVRFLPNPHWVEELRPLTGTDERGLHLRRRAADLVRRVRANGSSALLDVIMPGLRRRGEVVPDRRRRLHGGPAPLGGRCRGASRRYFRDAGLPATVEHRDLDRWQPRPLRNDLRPIRVGRRPVRGPATVSARMGRDHPRGGHPHDHQDRRQRLRDGSAATSSGPPSSAVWTWTSWP